MAKMYFGGVEENVVTREEYRSVPRTTDPDQQTQKRIPRNCFRGILFYICINQNIL